MVSRIEKLGKVKIPFGSGTVSADINDSNDDIMNSIGVMSELPYKNLESSGTFNNGDNTAAEEFVDADGINNTVNTFNESYYIIIEATSVTGMAINNCSVSEYVTGKWLLQCSTGTDEVKRAQIIKTLFYGSNGTDARITSTYITGLTAIYSTDSRDIGRRGIHAKARYTRVDPSVTITTDPTYTGTFNTPGSNGVISSWSSLELQGYTGTEFYNRYKVNGSEKNQLYSVNNDTNQISNEIGTDLSADETTNPANVQFVLDYISAQANFRQSATFEAIILAKDTVTWVFADSYDFIIVDTTTDYTTDNTIPLFGDANSIFVPSTDAIFVTDHYECKGGPSSFVSSKITCDTNTLAIDDETNAFCLYYPGEIPVGTSANFDITDGTNTTNYPVDITTKKTGVLPKGTLANIVNATIILNIIPTATITPKPYGWSIIKL